MAANFRQILFIFVVAALAAPFAHAIEISTGKMLGAGYDRRSFYIREGNGQWVRTYAGEPYRLEAAGRLMNLRIAQGVFDDEWLTESSFDPWENTRRLVAALDFYREHGILAISVSLQGGNAYERGAIQRSRHTKDGPGKGSLISAFRPDGSLKSDWMERLLFLIRELDRRGMVLDLMYFYQGRDEVLENTAAVDRAVRHATDWLIENNCRNVIIEIANEHDVASYDHDRYIHFRMGHLIELARKCFEEKNASFRLPISASTGGRMMVYEGVRDHADLVIIHGNGRTPDEKKRRTAELFSDRAMPGPIYMNEDENGRETTPDNLTRELASCDVVFENGGSWGYMPWLQVQLFPFRYHLPGSSRTVGLEMPHEERDPAYFHAVLEHIRNLVFRAEIAGKPCQGTR